MILNLLWMIVIYLMILFTLENYMFGILFYMLMVIFFGSIIMTMISSSVWMSMIFLIFMVGGLMVSFFYMVSLTHNMVLKISFHVVLLTMILAPSNSQTIINFHKVHVDSSFLFSSLSYLALILFMLFLLFLILFLIDFKLKAMKGFVKEI